MAALPFTIACVERLEISALASWIAFGWDPYREEREELAAGTCLPEYMPPDAFQTHWDLHIEMREKPMVGGGRSRGCGKIQLAEPFVAFALQTTDDFFRTWGRPQQPCDVIAALVAFLVDRTKRQQSLISGYDSIMFLSTWDITVS